MDGLIDSRHNNGTIAMDANVSKFEAAVDAVVEGDLDKLVQLLRENPELVHERSTLPHRATLLNYVGANGVENHRQKTPKNTVQIAEVLLRAGADVNAIANIYGTSDTLGLAATSIFPFLAGVQNALIDKLLEYGANINSDRIINACLANGRGAAAEHLANRGAPLDLEGAAGVGRLDLVKASLQEDGTLKPTVSQRQMECGFTWACEYGRTNVVEFLLAKGIKVDAAPHGITGLHWAAYSARVDIVQLLLERKAPVELKDGRHRGTPLGWAFHAWAETPPEAEPRPYPEVVSLLLAAGATFDSALPADPQRKTALLEKLRADPHMSASLQHFLR